MSVHTILLLPHLQAHNANALSSPFTVGFPAVTGFMGAAHALQRQLNKQGFSARFEGVGIVSHHANLQAYKGDNDFVHSLVGTGNPLDRTGERSAFIEEARVHLDISLVVQVDGLELDEYEAFVAAVDQLLAGRMKIAAGDLLAHKPVQLTRIDTEQPVMIETLQRQLMPGYVLVERRDLMIDAMTASASASASENDSLDALIDYLAIHHQCEVSSDSETDETVNWQSGRKTAGWIIPIATGFQGISELGLAKNQRDANTPHRFAESVVTLGEFVMPHRLLSLNHMLWRYRYDAENNLYLCTQDHILTNAAEASPVAPEENEFD